MKLLSAFFCFMLLVFAFGSLDAQSVLNEKIIENLNTYSSQYSPEKVFIHTDKSNYLKGDTLWYKAYVVNAVSHLPVAQNTVLYVELFDNLGELIFRHQLLCGEDIVANGDFVLSKGLKNGNYHLRSYTRSMMNWSEAFFFETSIVLNDFNQLSLKGSDHSIGQTNNLSKPVVDSCNVNLRLFPEGGNLVNGLKCRVAAQLINLDTESIGAIAYVYNNHSTLVTTFNFYERGLGQFNLEPVKGENYTVFVYLDQDTIKCELPDVIEKGFVINLNQRKDNLIIELKHNYEKNPKTYIVAHQRGLLCWNASIEFDDNNSFTRILPLDSLVAGVTQFTLFDNIGRPLVERLVYINKDFPSIDITMDKDDIAVSTEFELTLYLEQQKLIISHEEEYNCSISIYNEEFEGQEKSSQNIRTYLLLNSDLHGEIKDPAYFFEDKDRFRRLYLLDIIMMTHGWNRFTWEELRDENYFEALSYKNELGLMVRGHTGATLNRNKYIPSKVILNLMDQRFYEEEKWTDTEGNFEFGPFVTQDTFNAFLQARKSKSSRDGDKLNGNRNVMIYLAEPEYPSYSPDIAIGKYKDQVIITNEKSFKEFRTALYMKEKYDNMMKVELDEFVITGKEMTKNDSLNDIKNRLSVYGEPSVRLIIEDDDSRGVQSVFDLLRRVAGVSVNGSPPDQSVTIRGVASLNASTTPLYLINGMPVDESYINTLSPGEVIFIDVLKDGRAAIFGQRGSNGVIAVYTGYRSSASDERRSGIINFTLNGFYRAKEFYSPIRSSEYGEFGVPDTRTTMYWNPKLQIRSNEAQKLKLISSGIQGSYKIVLQGISEEGKLLYGISAFKVN